MNVERNMEDGNGKKRWTIKNKLKTMRPKGSTKTFKGAKENDSGQKLEILKKCVKIATPILLGWKYTCRKKKGKDTNF